MAELIPLPLTAVQKLRLLARQYDGVLVMQVHHFGLACKVQSKGFTIAFPIKWEVVESSSVAELYYIVNQLMLGETNEKPCYS